MLNHFEVSSVEAENEKQKIFKKKIKKGIET